MKMILVMALVVVVGLALYDNVISGLVAKVKGGA